MKVEMVHSKIIEPIAVQLVNDSISLMKTKLSNEKIVSINFCQEINSTMDGQSFQA